jgi:hypothetical protein
MTTVTRALRSPEFERSLFSSKTIFDGTKLPLAYNRPETTSNGMKMLFRLYSILQELHFHLTIAHRVTSLRDRVQRFLDSSLGPSNIRMLAIRSAASEVS